MASLALMTTAVLIFFWALLLVPAHAGPLSAEFIPARSNFTATNYQYIDQSGAFLASRSGAFKVAITNPKPQSRIFYLAVLHSDSGIVVWSANRISPVSDSAKLRLSITGLSITDDDGRLVWSTPPLPSAVALLNLQDSGNLVLLDQFNKSLWQSFDYPTDTLLIGQRLSVGKSLVGALNDGEFSPGDYQFTVTGGDTIMLWNGLIYWRLSMESYSYTDQNQWASYLAVNGSGLYLFGANTSVVVMAVDLGVSESRIAKLEWNGKFSVKSFNNKTWVQEVTGPADDCKIPNICGRIGLCSTGKCSCPPGFHANSQITEGCSPIDTSHSLPSACDSTSNGNGNGNGTLISYMRLGNAMDYFSNVYTDPVVHGVTLSVCENLCSQNCTCLGLFHENSSGSCYLLENYLGSIMSTETDRTGYIKAMFVPSTVDPYDGKQRFPILVLVLIPSSGSLLLFTLVVVGILWYRRRKRQSGNAIGKLGRTNSSSSAELEIISIPGLPVRFDYAELVAATENFKTQIGFGAFGTVYKGTLTDNTFVAVKKITSLGIQGKREFCTEIAIIGNIHHVNLVRLKGFCALGRQRFLVYEYMNRGSLDRVLFGKGPVLEWQERLEIALGTARGLAYLHSECDQKIIHCDVKPENILLHDNMLVKISDFGLSKLLSPEQSGLFTTMRGTRGYLAPEWLSNSAITDKSDVYSYGMVLLEIVRGRKNCSPYTHIPSTENAGSGGNDQSSTSSGSEHSVYFPLFALEMHEQRRYLELLDPRLEGRVTSEGVEKLIRVALCCVHEDPTLRPSMANVVGMLEGGLAVGVPRVESLNFLRFFGMRFTEASRIEGFNEQNEFAPYPRPNPTFNSSSSGSHNSFSYMSSQQVSGPR
ncbi:G-type lectin S-receptor-like serine/threonine-protein kinase At5g35370 [Actinidia eriantha]|uniref:G-type lectin S-receptor-like serine/threonine-protein kinase At5g35370 n=1 Tax=Actinidia eriantha TaxID=165200 RepID=UPI0025849E0E|nr:G-type lectin S-receptor-like serine/threonine-protein kinase At5g35370 [Actinidia eriantha]